MLENHQYIAEGTVSNKLFPVPVTITADSYQRLLRQMTQWTIDMRYFTEGVNGGILHNEQEPYTKDMIWPEVKWNIRIEKVKENNEKSRTH